MSKNNYGVIDRTTCHLVKTHIAISPLSQIIWKIVIVTIFQLYSERTVAKSGILSLYLH